MTPKMTKKGVKVDIYKETQPMMVNLSNQVNAETQHGISKKTQPMMVNLSNHVNAETHTTYNNTLPMMINISKHSYVRTSYVRIYMYEQVRWYSRTSHVCPNISDLVPLTLYLPAVREKTVSQNTLCTSMVIVLR